MLAAQTFPLAKLLRQNLRNYTGTDRTTAFADRKA
jgi:hypothetical protein